MKIFLIVFLLLFSKKHYCQQVLSFENQINLIPEGIAIDPGNGTIYISSIAQKKIIKISPGGIAENFIHEEQDGFQEGLGMKVDVKRKYLWALSNTRKGNLFTSHIHAFELSSGKQIHHYSIRDTVPHLLNDLIVHKSGSLYITDTYYSSVYKYEPSKNKLALFVMDTAFFKWPNGLALVKENKLVMATYAKGLVLVDLKSKEIKALPGYKDSSLAFGLDGLVINGKYLYGIYNIGKGGNTSDAVVKYKLNKKRNFILSERIIDRGNAVFADPTTAAKYRNKLYLISNSHLDEFNKNKETVNGIESKLTPLKILVYKL
jgi:sugar lactone lactonase YvrE